MNKKHIPTCLIYVCSCPVKHEDHIFISGNLIRHQDTLDVDLIVDQIIDKKQDSIVLKIRYWNRNYNIVIDPQPEEVEIKLKDFNKWSLVGWI